MKKVSKFFAFLVVVSMLLTQGSITTLAAYNIGDEGYTNKLSAETVVVEEELEKVTSGVPSTGTFGENGGFSWTFEEGTGTMVISGKDTLSSKDSTPFSLYKEMIRHITFSNCDFSGITDASKMFSGCSALESIDLGGLDFSNVTKTASMFSGCSSLVSVDLSGLDFSSVTNMNSMFLNCSSLESVNLRRLDLSNVTNMLLMFSFCGNLKTVDFDEVNVSNATTTGMFTGCTGLKSIHTPKVLMETQSIGLPITMQDKNGNQTDAITFEHADIMLYSIEPVIETKGVFGDDGDFSWTFDVETGTLEVTGKDTISVKEETPFYKLKDHIRYIVFDDCNFSKLTDMSSLFAGCSKLESVDFSDMSLTNATDMSKMFEDCSSLVSVSFKKTLSTKLTNISGMFSGCSSLATVNWNKMNLSKVTNASSLFSGCSSLTNPNLSGLNFSSVTNTASMFSGCSSLENVNLSGLNLSKVTNMSLMFYGCKSLNSFDLSALNAPNVTNMMLMFSGCKNLETVNLSGYDMSNVSVSMMFLGCKNLQEIKTPKVLLEDQVIALPVTMKDEKGKRTDEITSAHCNMVLYAVAEGEEEPIETEGVFGDNNGFRWELDPETGVLLISGKDSIASYKDTPFYKHKDIITNIKFVNCDFSMVTDMTKMFANCSSLENIDLSGLNLSNVTKMTSLFSGCSNLKSVTLKGTNLSSLTNTSSMFLSCTSLKSIDLSGLDFSNVTSMIQMFSGCSSLENIDFGGLNLSSANTLLMFNGCKNIQVIYTPKLLAEGQSIGLPVTMKDEKGNLTKSITSEYCDMVLVLQPEPTSTIALNKTKLELINGNAETLIATVTSTDEEPKSVVWTSSDENVAIVDANGKVTAVGVGTAVITAIVAEESTITASCNVTVKPITVTNITLNKTSLELISGNTAILTATATPTNAENKAVKWSSSNKKVATVDENGKVTAVGAGTATIKATATDGSGVSASCSVTVTPILVSSITLNKTILELISGNSETLTATIAPSNADNSAVAWSSSNTKVAKVDSNGKVTAVGVGTAVITVTAKDDSGKTASCNVTVTPVLASGITLNKTSLELMNGDAESLTATVMPEDAGINAVTWTSSNTNVAIVDAKGMVTAVGVGTADIIATATDGSGVSASCKVTVKPILVSALTLNKTSLDLLNGSSEVLIATATPTNAENKEVKWTSSNEKVATVDANGKVKAVGLGTTVITAIAMDGSGVSATCNVTVKTVLSASVTLNKNALELINGGTEVLSATITPTDTENQTVTWSSSNTSVATVDTKGKVTAVGVGTAVITATATDGSGVSANCVVTVKPVLVTNVSLDKTSLELINGRTGTITATATPTNAENKAVVWTSSNESVATVDANGKVTAVGVGAAIITATAADGSGKSANCIVTVKPVLVSAITLNKTKLELINGNTQSLTAIVTPTNAENKAINWTSSNTNVAIVDANGKITAVGAGTAIVTATATDGSGVNASCTVTVKAVGVSSISLNKTSLELMNGTVDVLTATVSPTNAENKSVTWTSSNTNVAIVDANGKVTAVGEGTAVITATAKDGSGISASCNVTVRPILVSSITLNRNSFELEVEGVETLIAIVTPSNAANQAITWTSSNTNVAIVDANGKVTAVGEGAAVITATAKDGSGVSANCIVTVKSVLSASITLNKTNIELTKGNADVLYATITPADLENLVVTWTSSNTSVAVVDASGKVTAVGVGTAVITATAQEIGGISTNCIVTVKPELVSSVTLNKSTLELINGSEEILSATVNPSSADNKAVIWTSSNTSVAIVDANGKVTAVGVGTAIISATAVDGSGKTATCTVTVKPVLVSSISLNKTTLELVNGSVDVLTATVSPSNAANKAVTWTSSNTNVVIVDSNGKVTAVGTGTAVITAKASDGSGKTASCTITVKPILVSSITLNKTTLELVNGNSDTLTAIVNPSNAGNKAVTWTSSNTNIATVDANGKITAVGVGSAIITVTAKDGSGVSANCVVTVKPVLVSNIALNKTNLELIKGNAATLTVTVNPSNAANKSVIWTSSNTNIATVDANGKVTAVSVGTTVITATAKDGSGATANCIVTVKPVLVSSITLNKTNLELLNGTTGNLSATVNPSNAENKAVIWTSSNTNVATVDASGKVTAVGVGTAVITATAADGSGKLANCNVTVKPILVSNITLSKTTLELVNGNVDVLTATVNPSNAANKAVTWSSSNTNIATVDASGKVTAVGVGSAVITATAKDGSGISASCNITVKPVLSVNISINKTSLELFKGETEELTATVTPANVANKAVNWTSSNANIAIVDSNGKVTAVNVGTVVITATAKDGSGASTNCIVTVKPVLVSSISLNKTTVELINGNNVILAATANPSNAENKTVTWTSSNTNVAVVDANGRVTAVGVGTAVITATATDGSGKEASCKVTVKPVLVSTITLNKSSLEIINGNVDVLSATVNPSNAANKAVTWTTSNSDVVIVDLSGKITAVGVGTAVVTATATDGSGVSASCNVTVTPILSVNVTLDHTNLELFNGGVGTLTATVTPANVANKSVTWISSNTNIAIVDENGRVTAVNVGTAVITATAKDGSGATASCVVTVKPVLVTLVTLNKTEMDIIHGEAKTLTATVTPTNADNKAVTWTSSNENIAVVDANGKVTAVGLGTVTITATAADGSGKKAQCTVIVKQEYEDGLNEYKDGKLYYFKEDQIDTTYNGIADYKGDTWYVKDGVVDTTINGLMEVSGNWYLFANGKVNRTTTLASYGGAWWYIENGQVNFNYDGLANHSGKTWYIEDGMVDFSKNGIHQRGDWYYFKGGAIDREFTGLTNSAYGWWYIEEGAITFNYTTLVYYSGSWWYVQNSNITFQYDGVVDYNNSTWYVEDSKVDFSKNGLYQRGGWYYFKGGAVDRNFTGLTNSAQGWWYIEKGVITFKYTNLVKYNGSWWYVQNSNLTFKYDGVVDYNGSTWYVEDSKVDFSKNGLYQRGGWYYFKGGAVDRGFTGLTNSPQGWWYIEKGTITFKYTGLAKYNGSWWYVENSKLDFTYRGLVEHNGSLWYVNEGRVDFSYTNFFIFDGKLYKVIDGKATLYRFI